MLGYAPLGGAPIGASLSLGSPTNELTMVRNIRVVDTVACNLITRPTASDAVTLTTTGVFGFAFDIAAGSGVVVSETAAFHRGFFGALSDNAQLVDTTEITRALAMLLIDATRVTESTNAARGVVATAAETLAFDDLLDVIYSLAVVERLRIADPHIINWIANVDAADLVAFEETLRQMFPVGLAEELGFSVEQLAQTAIRLLERLRIQPQLRANAIFNVSVTQLVRLRESLGNFFGAEIAEGVAFADELTTRKIAVAALAETLGIEAALAPQFLLSVRVAEGLGIDDIDAINMLFAPTIVEGVEINAGYVAPDGSFTAWAMNTRTAAVTEYRNFAFNSFARVGNRYLAASADGLFELLGDDDAGDDIIARVRSGFMQFGGTQLSRLKSAYIAARGEGEMLLKVIDGDGREYVYSCDTRDMRSTKVHMGKGMRSRYFAFELVTTGQDFDIDTIEFVPIVVQRRV